MLKSSDRRGALMLIIALAVVFGSAVADPAQAAEGGGEGFTSAEDAYTERHRQRTRPPEQRMHELAGRRADLLAAQDRARVALAVELFNCTSLIDASPRTMALRLSDTCAGAVPGARRIVAWLDEVVARIEEAAGQGGDWDRFGLDYAIFPVNVTDEFVDSWGAPRSGGRRHKGTDLLGAYGTELYAIEDGHIERTSSSSLGGLSLYLQGDSGARYFYAHLSSFGEFSDGQRVRSGDIVGFNGDSGNAGGTPHLHLQWAPEGGEQWVNAYELLASLWIHERGRPPPQG